MTTKNVSYWALEDINYSRQIDYKTNKNREVGICGKYTIILYKMDLKLKEIRLTCITPFNAFLVSMQIKVCGI